MIEILNKDIVVARQIENTNIIKSLDTGLDIPFTLFGDLKKGEVDLVQFVKWLETRVFPRERVDAKEQLEKLGLKEYNHVKIAQLTNAKLFSDRFSVRWS